MSSPSVLYFCDPDATPTAFLSNVYPSKFIHDGILFRSVEHWMMYNKAITFGDDEIAEQVLATLDPEATTALGRKVRGFNSAAWAAKSLHVVTQGNILKYTQSALNGELITSPTSKHSTPLRDLMLATGDAELVEAAPRDRRWGVGFSKETVCVSRRAEWGENRSGQAAMRARDVVRSLAERDICSAEGGGFGARGKSGAGCGGRGRGQGLEFGFEFEWDSDGALSELSRSSTASSR